MSKTSQAIFAKRMPFTSALVYEALAKMFDGMRPISRRDAYSALNAFAEEKGWTLRKSIKFMNYIFERGFFREKGKNLLVVKTKFESLAGDINGETENMKKEEPPSEIQKSLRQSKKLAKMESAKVAPNETDELMLRTIFTGKIGAKFLICKVQKSMYGFMCAQWNVVKENAKKEAEEKEAASVEGAEEIEASSKEEVEEIEYPTKECARVLFEKMARRGIIKKIDSLFARITYKGAMYCGLSQKPEKKKRQSKADKFKKLSARYERPAFVSGFRTLKKAIARLRETNCNA